MATTAFCVFMDQEETNDQQRWQFVKLRWLNKWVTKTEKKWFFNLDLIVLRFCYEFVDFFRRISKKVKGSLLLWHADQKPGGGEQMVNRRNLRRFRLLVFFLSIVIIGSTTKNATDFYKKKIRILKKSRNFSRFAARAWSNLVTSENPRTVLSIYKKVAGQRYFLSCIIHQASYTFVM